MQCLSFWFYIFLLSSTFSLSRTHAVETYKSNMVSERVNNPLCIRRAHRRLMITCTTLSSIDTHRLGSLTALLFFFTFYILTIFSIMASRQNKNEEDDESQNPGSPYYLHLRENPGLILVSPPLDGNNYHTWSRAMKRALLSKNKVKFIYGRLQEKMKRYVMHGSDAM